MYSACFAMSMLQLFPRQFPPLDSTKKLPGRDWALFESSGSDRSIREEENRFIRSIDRSNHFPLPALGATSIVAERSIT